MDMRDSILVTGGAGFIGSNFVLQWIEKAGTPLVNLDALTYAGNAENLESLKGDARHHFVRGDIGDADQVATLLREHRPSAHRPFRRREPRRPLDRRSRRFHPDQCAGHVQSCWSRPRRYWRQLDPAARDRRSAFCTCRRMRSTARWDRTIRLLRDDGLRAEQPLCRVEGVHRITGARLPPHLRLPVADHQLLEQLRSVSVSGEVDPADDSECARGQAAAGLWRRPERARLALRGGSLRRDSRRAGARAAWARPTTSAATASARTSTW